MVRNWVKRSTLRCKRGEALVRVRTLQPANGNCVRAASRTTCTSAALSWPDGRRN